MENTLQIQAGLLKLLAEDTSIDELLEYCCERLGNPVALLNALYEPVSCKSPGEVEDTLWNAMFTGRSADYIYGQDSDVIKEIVSQINRMISDDVPIFLRIDSKHRNIIKKISHNNRIFGYFSCLEYETDFPENMMEIVTVLSHAFSIQLQKMNSYTITNASPVSDLFRIMLSGKDHHMHSSGEIFQTLLGEPMGRYYMITAPYEKEIYTEQQLVTMCAQLSVKKYDHRSLAIVFEDSITAILNVRDGAYSKTKNILSALFAEYRLSAGLSAGFEDAHEIHKHYMQARRTAGIAKERGNVGITVFETVMIQDILENLDAKTDISQYCLDTVRNIHRHDQRNHTEYLETLYAYIRLAGNITDVGRLMQTHRNTIVHRLERMKELFSVRLSDGEELARLYIGIIIIKMS